MANEPKLVAQKRSKLGTAECRRLRRRGITPGNIYGHEQTPIAIAAPEDAIAALIQGGHRVVDLDLEGARDKALFQEVQWDTFTTQVQHFDLLRISAGERLTVEVNVELHGVAPGVKAGGNLEQPLRSLTVECPALEIPDSIEVNINELEIGDTVHVRDLPVPEGVVIQDPPEATVVQIVEAPSEEELAVEEEEEGMAPVEPELIRREGEEEGEEGSGEE